MRQFTCLFLALSCLGLVVSQHVLAGQQLDVHDGSAITITSPQNGAKDGWKLSEWV